MVVDRSHQLVEYDWDWHLFDAWNALQRDWEHRTGIDILGHWLVRIIRS